MNGKPEWGQLFLVCARFHAGKAVQAVKAVQAMKAVKAVQAVKAVNRIWENEKTG